MGLYFLSDEQLPRGFAYPEEYLRLINQGIVCFRPWMMLEGDELKFAFTGLKQRYPKSLLVPFACRINNDDVICWDVLDNNRVIRVHDFSDWGYEKREMFESFWSWFRSAIEDFIVEDYD